MENTSTNLSKSLDISNFMFNINFAMYFLKRGIGKAYFQYWGIWVIFSMKNHFHK
jgi:hypothetical protein